MDLVERTYTENDYIEYIYGSAEVVGLMCLKVFCEGDEKKYNSLVEPARKLGSAFQKVNFLRDMKSDFSERGRVYFPQIDFTKSIMVGNKITDMQFGRNAGMSTVFVATTNPDTAFPNPLIDARFENLNSFANNLMK